MLRGRELKLMIALDLIITLIFVLRSYVIIDIFSELVISLQAEQEIFWFTSEQLFWFQVGALMLSYSMNYISAWVVIKKKHIRERATRIL